jgi:hypothetical protein
MERTNNNVKIVEVKSHKNCDYTLVIPEELENKIRFACREVWSREWSGILFYTYEGSYVGFLLARVKPKAIFIYDDDTVDEANMSGQLYGLEDVGKTKVGALAEMVSNYANYYGICGIRKFILSGTVYWASTGLILDEDLNPLFLCTIDLSEKEKTKCYVSPKVFESSSPLSKGIVFTVLNVMYNYGIITLHGKIQKPEVIIGPIDNIVKPTVPSSVDTFNDDVNDFLADNVDVVMRQWE